MRGMSVMKGRVQLVAEETTSGVDGWLLIVIAGLCCFGLVMVYSASEALGYLWYGNVNYFFVRQLLCMGFGAVAMAVTARIDYHRWRVLTKPLVLLTLAMMILVLVPHIGVAVNGAQRWFSFGFVTIQPSEIAAVVAIIGFARWLADRKSQLHEWRIVRDYTFILTVFIGLILLERDLGTAIVAACVAFLLLVLAGARTRHLAMVIGFMAVLAYVGVHMESYRLTRIASFANPFADPLNSGFQSVQALLAFGSGGLTGVGLGNSIEKYQWLPEAHTDFIFAIIGEELGLIGTLCVVGAFIFLVWRGVRAARRAPDFYGTLLAGGIIAWIGFQAFINIGAVTDLIPTTGIPLPFISYGGTALVMTLFGLGILCNISSQGRRQGVQRRAYVDRWRGNGGTSDSGARGRGGAAVF
jgi:cell division protein FtsW